MSIDDQRRYGTAFRAIDEFERRVKEPARLSDRAASLARDELAHWWRARPAGQDRSYCPAVLRLASSG